MSCVDCSAVCTLKYGIAGGSAGQAKYTEVWVENISAGVTITAGAQLSLYFELTNPTDTNNDDRLILDFHVISFTDVGDFATQCDAGSVFHAYHVTADPAASTAA